MVNANLSDRQKAFADYYIATLNAYESAVKAGYSARYAKGNSYKLVENSGIKAYIDAKLQNISNDRIARAEEVMEYLTRVMRGEEKEIEAIVNGEGEETQIESMPLIRERTKAAELIGKRYAMFVDKQESKADTTIKIELSEPLKEWAK